MSNNLTSLNNKQKIKVAVVLFSMLIVLSVLFFLNSSHIILSNNIEKSIMIFGLLFLLTFGLYYYLINFSKSNAIKLKHLLMIVFLLLISFQANVLFIGAVIGYARPLLMLTMLVTILIGKKEALFLNFYLMFVLYLFDVYSSGFIFSNSYAIYSILSIFISGTVAVFLTSAHNHRLNTILSAFKLGFLSMLTGIFVFVLVEGFSEAVFFIALASYMSAHFSLLLYLGLLPLFERLFNIVTIYRLNELTDHNRNLLKKLALHAPGTYNHCISVSKLAEVCAIAIGESPQLARAAAYYHDIGKIKNPLYFKENQDEINPHDDLTPELSVSFIKKHANEGYNICRENGLPEEIADICLQHHGTTVIKYFYFQAKKFTDGSLSIDQFRYEGPKPQTKIAVIIMICDAAEAVIRVLKNRSKELIREKVNEIIDERMELEQFSDCDITMRDLYAIIDQIVTISAGIYHERIEYPKIKFSRKGEAVLTNDEETDKEKN